jgi:alkylation response protein AidB-like acyl-CoA dehydrogenase
MLSKAIVDPLDPLHQKRGSRATRIVNTGDGIGPDVPPSALTDEQRMIADTVADLAAREFADDAFEWDVETPWPNLEHLATQGLLGPAIPEEYGGGGLGMFEELLLVEGVSRVCPDTGWSLVHNALSPVAVARFGTEAAKERYLPPICAGETKMATGISEPHAGSDVTAMNTSLEADGGEYYLNGEKTWVSAVEDSESAIVWATLSDGSIGSAIMEFDSPGVEIITESTNMVGHTQTQFVMDDVRVPEENLLITDDAGWKDQLAHLNWERVIIAAWTHAITRCGIEHALDYATDREQFGQPIGEFQGMRWKFADMVTTYEAGRSLTYRTAQRARETGDPPGRLMSGAARLFASESSERIVSEALQVFGANGYQQGHPLEYLYRYVRSRRIGHGTDEIMKVGIADRVFDVGLPD